MINCTLCAAAQDSAKMLIPTLGVVYSSCKPRLISYPIHGNDDTMESVSFLGYFFSRAINNAKNRRRDFLASLALE